MVRIDEQSYEEAIDALQKFKTEIEEQCEDMRSVGENCVTNSDNDDNAVKCNESLVQCLTKIEGTLETIDDVISKLNEKLDADKRKTEITNKLNN